MDIATILGLVLGILVVLEAAGGVVELYQGTVLVLVLVGGIAATLVAFPLRDALNVFAVVKNVFFLKKIFLLPELIERLVSFAETVRRQGILALENATDERDDPFLVMGVRLAVDGTEPDLIMDIMETELQFIEQRHKRGQDLMHNLGHNWALFGGIGALLMLVQGRGGSGAELTGQIALPLLYGALLYGLVGGPFARRLLTYSQDEILAKRMMIESIMAIQSGDNPRLVEHKLASFLQPKDRPLGEKPIKPAVLQPLEEDKTCEEVAEFIAEKKDLILRLVRETTERHAADPAQKAALEAAAARVERGEMSLVGMLALLDHKVQQELLYHPRLVADMAPRAFDFADIAKLSDWEIQVLLREVTQADCVIALKGASDELRERVLGNMSERVRTFISMEMGYLHDLRPQEVLMVQTRIMAQVLRLAQQEQITLLSVRDGS